MSMQAPSTVVVSSVVVEAPLERAFKVFTEDMQSWWPKEHHICEVAQMVFEPRVGGRIYDVATDGSESHWARILVYEPPARLVFTWDLGLDWAIQSDLAKTSEVEVRFIELAPGRTRVELEHRNIDRHGDGWEQMRDSVASPGGWQLGLDSFARRVEQAG